MKKVLFILSLLTMFIGGAVTASSINGDYHGNPIVRVLVNGQPVQSEVPAQIIDGSTLLPLRAIGDALGADVNWDPNSYTATITTQKPQTAALTQEQLKEIGKYVAKVYAVNADGQVYGQGSGFLIEGGVLVTNEHVGGAAKSLRIELNGQTYTTSDVLFKDAATDVMGVRINASGGLKYSTQLPAVDDPVYAIGYPLENFKINEGKVLEIRPVSGVDYITTTAKTESGQSGGVLINVNGEAIGITKGIFDGTDIEVAVPMKYVQMRLEKVK